MDTTCFCWLVSLKLADRFNYGQKKNVIFGTLLHSGLLLSLGIFSVPNLKMKSWICPIWNITDDNTNSFCWLVRLKLADSSNYGPQKRYFGCVVILRVGNKFGEASITWVWINRGSVKVSQTIVLISQTQKSK